MHCRGHAGGGVVAAFGDCRGGKRHETSKATLERSLGWAAGRMARDGGGEWGVVWAKYGIGRQGWMGWGGVEWVECVCEREKEKRRGDVKEGQEAGSCMEV